MPRQTSRAARAGLRPNVMRSFDERNRPLAQSPQVPRHLCDRDNAALHAPLEVLAVGPEPFVPKSHLGAEPRRSGVDVFDLSVRQRPRLNDPSQHGVRVVQASHRARTVAGRSACRCRSSWKNQGRRRSLSKRRGLELQITGSVCCAVRGSWAGGRPKLAGADSSRREAKGKRTSRGAASYGSDQRVGEALDRGARIVASTRLN